jgi:hypothetical protein
MQATQIAVNVFSVTVDGNTEIVTGAATPESAIAIYLEARQPPPVTEGDYTAAIEAHCNHVAKSRGYEGTISLVSYVSSAVPQWAAEAKVFSAWRDAVWVYAYEQLALVRNAQRSIPTVDGFVSELPVISWPQ